jgi:hypothetical protein
MAFGRRRQTHPTEAVGHNGIVVNIKRLTATGKTVHFASTHPGSDTLPNQVTFQFRDGAYDGQEKPSHCSVCRDVLPARKEFDAEAVKFIDN